MSQPPDPDMPQRLVSLDAYRGFVMLLMVSGGFALGGASEVFEHSRFWARVSYEFSHTSWTGCSFWDLIQPSFMFIVGVAMPYSYAKRRARGDSPAKTAGHVIYRALFLILLGVFLRSNRSTHTNFTFEDVVTQIGLGYGFVYLVLGKGFRVQATALVAILVGYWLLFALWPLPGPGFDPAAHNIPNDWNQLAGFAAHWNKHVNPAGWFDRWFLNLFPRPQPFHVNGGGYQTLNFIPSMATMIFGVMTGELLRSPRQLNHKLRRLILAGGACLLAGLAVDGHIWPFLDWQWSLAPIVKRIWTPSWAVFSTGWALWMLAGFLWLIDAKGHRRWAFPLIVVGMNSITMYVMSWLVKSWVIQTLKTHLGQDLFAGKFGPFYQSVAAVFVLWLVCLWLYRRKIFIRI